MVFLNANFCAGTQSNYLIFSKHISNFQRSFELKNDFLKFLIN